jgi:hypothetical protein
VELLQPVNPASVLIELGHVQRPNSLFDLLFQFQDVTLSGALSQFFSALANAPPGPLPDRIAIPQNLLTHRLLAAFSLDPAK